MNIEYKNKEKGNKYSEERRLWDLLFMIFPFVTRLPREIEKIVISWGKSVKSAFIRLFDYAQGMLIVNNHV